MVFFFRECVPVIKREVHVTHCRMASTRIIELPLGRLLELNDLCYTTPERGSPCSQSKCNSLSRSPPLKRFLSPGLLCSQRSDRCAMHDRLGQLSPGRCQLLNSVAARQLCRLSPRRYRGRLVTSRCCLKQRGRLTNSMLNPQENVACGRLAAC